MASFRSFPSQSSFAPPPPPPNQNPIPLPPSHRANQYPPNNRAFPDGGSQSSYPPPPVYNHYGSSSASSHHYAPQQQQQQQQQQHQYPYLQHQQQPPPPQPQSQQLPPPPIYYPSSQYSQFNPQSVLPPPPAPAPQPPPPSSPPPPPPPSKPPPLPPAIKETRNSNHAPSRGDRDHRGENHGGNSRHGLPPTQHRASTSVAPVPAGRVPHVPNGPAGRIETEEERKIRKKKEYEKQKQEEKNKQTLKESQNTILQKMQMLSSAVKGHGSMAGSRLGEKRTPFLTGERIENRLRKPTTFICKLKFRNELPDPTAQPKLLSLNTNKDLYTKYTITSMEKMHKPKLFVEPDLGIPLDLLDISVYNPPSTRPPLAPEDEELLRDSEFTTPVKQNGIRKKDRPDEGFSWLVKTQYISPLSMDQAKTSLTEKQAKELREMKGGRNILENLNTRDSQIKAIEATFEACKSSPVHATNKKLQPVEVLPLLPDFYRYEDQFVLASFDSNPTADSEAYSKLDRSARDDLESQAIMKSFVGNGSGQDKFLAYMVPLPDELWKDIYDEQEDVSYTWIREYNWDVKVDDVDDPSTYLVAFNEEAAHYLPLATKLNLRKKRAANEGRSNAEVEHYPVPSRVTVRLRATVAAMEMKETRGYTNLKENTPVKRRSSDEDALETRHKVARLDDMDNLSEAEDEMSE